MESWIRMKKAEQPNGITAIIYVPIGIDPERAFYPLATEFGTATIKAGTPEYPVGRWRTKSKAGATMPWMRPAAVSLHKRLSKSIKNEIMQQIRRSRVSSGFVRGY